MENEIVWPRPIHVGERLPVKSDWTKVVRILAFVEDDWQECRYSLSVGFFTAKQTLFGVTYWLPMPPAPE